MDFKYLPHRVSKLIASHEPTAVKREMTENVSGETTCSTTEEAREKARRSGMTKGTADAEE